MQRPQRRKGYGLLERWNTEGVREGGREGEKEGE